MTRGIPAWADSKQMSSSKATPVQLPVTAAWLPSSKNPVSSSHTLMPPRYRSHKMAQPTSSLRSPGSSPWKEGSPTMAPPGQVPDSLAPWHTAQKQGLGLLYRHYHGSSALMASGHKYSTNKVALSHCAASLTSLLAMDTKFEVTKQATTYWNMLISAYGTSYMNYSVVRVVPARCGNAALPFAISPAADWRCANSINFILANGWSKRDLRKH